MCGISGFSWNDTGLIDEMNRVNRFRGPDAENRFCDDTVSLGHTRLSIIDLSDRGLQPMKNEDGSLILVYNGEIYNFMEIRTELVKQGHKFKSNTDSEVILHAYEEYGLSCLDMFNGMWAFCLYDTQKKQFILSRDRFGVKPLYYYTDGNRFIFSSMISALFVHDIKREADTSAVMNYLAFSLEDHDETTFYAGIRKVPPGHTLIYDIQNRNSTVRVWYQPKKKPAPTHDEVKETFKEAVRLRTVSDVPVGVCLSGGVDSSAIACILHTILPYPFTTYSFAVPGHASDETRFIRAVSEVITAEQIFTGFGSDTFIDDFIEFIRAQEEPVTGFGPYAEYRVMKVAHEHGAKVLLNGQGGDEIYAGYEYYFAWYLYELIIKGNIIRFVSELVLCLKHFKSILVVQMLIGFFIPTFLLARIFRLYSLPWLNHQLVTDTCQKDPRWRRLSLRDGLSLTLHATAIPHLLRWSDKSSMRWSIESRLPFLDVHVVEQAQAIPSYQKLKDGRTKVMFRKSMEGVIPDDVQKRRDKIGFCTSGADFFRRETIASFITEIMLSPSFQSRPYWRADRVESLVADHMAGKDNAKSIFKLVSLELWLREFIDEDRPVNETVVRRYE